MTRRSTDPKPSTTGEQLAALRKAAGLSQQELADAIGIPQRTLSYYERSAKAYPVTLLAPLAQALGLSMEEVLGLTPSPSQRRGPKSRIERQFEKIKNLPRSRQQFIARLLDDILAND